MTVNELIELLEFQRDVLDHGDTEVRASLHFAKDVDFENAIVDSVGEDFQNEDDTELNLIVLYCKEEDNVTDY